MEMKGPPDYKTWLMSFRVFRAACILNIIGVNALDNYQAKIAHFNQQYGTRVWALLYQADVRMRLEEMPAMLWELTEEAEAVTKAGGDHEFGPDRPWKLVWKRAVSK